MMMLMTNVCSDNDYLEQKIKEMNMNTNVIPKGFIMENELMASYPYH